MKGQPLNDFYQNKVTLEKASLAYKLAMEKDIQNLFFQTRKVGKRALLTTAVLVCGIFILKKMMAKPYTNPASPTTLDAFTPPKKDSYIVALIKKQIALYLFTVAKEKIKILLEKSEEKPAQSRYIEYKQ